MRALIFPIVGIVPTAGTCSCRCSHRTPSPGPSAPRSPHCRPWRISWKVERLRTLPERVC